MKSLDEDKQIMGVQLGRFTPYHKGHGNVTDGMLERHGPENSLVMIGSSNRFDAEDTPYTYEQRAQIIQCVHPGIKIIPLPDIDPSRKDRDDVKATFQKWLDSIAQIETEHNARFTFYGGSSKDLEYLSHRFNVQAIVDRRGDMINASKVRAAIKTEDRESLKKWLHPNIIELAIRYYKENMLALSKTA